MLFRSWATPAAIVPIAAIFSVRTSRACALCSSRKVSSSWRFFSARMSSSPRSSGARPRRRGARPRRSPAAGAPDVRNAPLAAGKPAVASPDGPPRERGPEHCTVTPPQAGLEVPHLARLPEQRQELLPPREVVPARLGQSVELLHQPGRSVVPEHARQRGVGGQQPAVPGDLEDPLHGVVEQVAILPLGDAQAIERSTRPTASISRPLRVRRKNSVPPPSPGAAGAISNQAAARAAGGSMTGT